MNQPPRKKAPTVGQFDNVELRTPRQIRRKGVENFARATGQEDVPFAELEKQMGQPPRKRSDLAIISETILGPPERRPMQQKVVYDERRYLWVRKSDNRIMVTNVRPNGPEAIDYYAELVGPNIWQDEKAAIAFLSKSGGPLFHRLTPKRRKELEPLVTIAFQNAGHDVRAIADHDTKAERRQAGGSVGQLMKRAVTELVHQKSQPPRKQAPTIVGQPTLFDVADTLGLDEVDLDEIFNF